MKKVVILLATIAIFVALVEIPGQKKHKDLLVNDKIVVQTNNNTNIREDCCIGDSGVVICKAEGIRISATEYYCKEHTNNGTWYGFRAEDVPDGAPRKLVRWARKNPNDIFWVSTGGGARKVG